jgi:hypothetical protein
MYRLGMACVAVSTACALIALLCVYPRGFFADLLHALRLPPTPAWLAHLLYVWVGAGLAGAVLFAFSHAPRSPRRWLGSLPLFAFFAYLIAMPIFSRAIMHYNARHSRTNSCKGYQRMIAIYTLMYAQDHEDLLPKSWEEVGIEPRWRICPGTKRYFHQSGGYGMNAALRGASLESVQDPAATLLTADAVRITSYLRTPEEIDYSRHGKYRDPAAIVTYLDGHLDTLHPGARVRLR